MASVEETIDIAAPVDRVFSALTDPRRTTEWNMNVLEVKDISDSVPREGTTWTQVTLVSGRPAHLTCRVTVYRPPHEGTLEISGDYKGRTWSVCKPNGAGTRVTQGVEFTLPGGLLGRMATGFATRLMRNELKETMARQRAILEEEAAKNGPEPS